MVPSIPFWPMYGVSPRCRGNFDLVTLRWLKSHRKTVQICVRLYTLIALSKQEPAPLTKPVSDHRDQRYGRFCGPTPHVRYPTFGTNGLK